MMWTKAAANAVAVVVLAGLAASCSPQGGNSQASSQHDRPAGTTYGRTALSAFLAGRVAQGQGDIAAAADYYAAALARDPDNSELLQRTFTLMIAEGRVEGAVPMARRLQDLDSEAAMPLLVAGLADVRDGLMVQAESRFAGLPRRGLNGLVGPLLSAWALAGQGRTDQALEALEPLAQTRGFLPVKAYHSALINDLAGRAEAAEAGYAEALSGQLSIRGIEAAGSLYQRRGQMDLARALYDRYQQDHPETMLFEGAPLLAQGSKIAPAVPNAQAGMAEALFDVATLMRQGNGQEAATLFSQLALFMRPDFALARTVLGDMLSAQDHLAAANAIYGGIGPDAAAAFYGQLRQAVNLEEMGQTAAAMAILEKLSTAHPDSLEPLIAKGDLLRRKKRFSEAANAYDQAVNRLGPALGPQHWPLIYSRGICFERIKQWPKAEADFKKALELKPDQPDVLNYLGYSWVDAGINLEEGRAMLEKAASLRPRDGAIIDSLGWALYRLGDYKGAVRYLERAAELKAEDPTINEHLGDALWQVGRNAEAQFQWHRALSLDPEPEMLEALKEKVRTGQMPPAKPTGK